MHSPSSGTTGRLPLTVAGRGIPGATIDWAKVFALDTPPLEIFLRGSLMYLALFALLRVLLKRESGTTGMTDLLVVLIADAAQNGMAGTYSSISDGLLLVAVIIGWSFVLDVVAYRWKWAERQHAPGAGHARGTDGTTAPAGHRRPRRVSRAYMESDGQFSFVMASGEAYAQKSAANSGCESRLGQRFATACHARSAMASQ